MKNIKKLAAMLLTICLVFPIIGLNADAAEGTLMFSDPQTKVGENVTVDLVVNSGGAAIGDVQIVMNYDASALEFVSGTDVTSDGAGTLTYSFQGTGNETELKSTIEFRALKQGQANITVSSHTAYLYSDEALNLSEGSSMVTVDAGADGSTSAEPSGTAAAGTEGQAAATDVKVDVNGKEYSLSETFTIAAIPEGYTETKLTYSGAERKFVANENGVTLGYLVDAEGNAEFFLYNPENATFAPFVEMHISENVSIVLLNDAEQVSLPKQFQEAVLQVGDYEFPAWQDMENEGYYAVYALNTAENKKELYRYDTKDETYQRLILPETTKEEKPKSDDSFLGKLKDAVYSHFTIAAAAAAAVLALLFILLIVLAVKLAHRNAELDDLYEEYDIPDDEPEERRASKKSRKQFAGFGEDEDELVDADDFMEEDAYDDEYEYEDDEYDYDEDDYEYEEDEDDEEDYDDEDEFFEDDVKESPGRKSARKKKKDAYEMDFIDL